jgi:hypothetical protein
VGDDNSLPYMRTHPVWQLLATSGALLHDVQTSLGWFALAAK